MILNCVYVIYQIMMIPLFINILPMLNLGCGDVLFFEKNANIIYEPSSKFNGQSKISTPALDLVIELDKKRFGNIKYDGKLTNNHSLMLYAYKSSMNLHIYKVCPNDIINNFNITGPIITNHNALIGYHMDVIDYRIAHELYIDNFAMFGDTDILRNLSGIPFDKGYHTQISKKPDVILLDVDAIKITFTFFDIAILIIFIYIFRQVSII